MCNVDAGVDEKDENRKTENRDTFFDEEITKRLLIVDIFTACSVFFFSSLQIHIYVLIGVKSLRVTEMLLKH